MSSERLVNANSDGHTGNTTETSAKFEGRRCQSFLFILCLCGVLLYAIYVARIQPELNQYSNLEAYIRSRKPSYDDRRPRTILLWNSFFDYPRWGLPDDTLSPDYFRDQRCPVVNCVLTNKKDFLPAVDLFNAIVFHVAEPFALTANRHVTQHYVFALLEPPGETRHMLGDEGGFYNLTMSYRLDSDILWPYMHFEDIESGALVSPALSPSWRHVPEEFNDQQFDKVVAGKKKFAAWFVSHCDTSSKRERLTKSLQKYVNVDVFGACGPLKCPHDSIKCNLMLDTDYKFYFAFENSLCVDYVTEKFFNALKRQIVPVVFGGANYTRFAPPGSYINVDDFKTVKELADYLIYLNDHPREYVRYFWWRQYYRLAIRSPFCELCEKLNGPAATKKVQFYSDINNWWHSGSCNFEPKILF